jgi:hypothetical protein
VKSPVQVPWGSGMAISGTRDGPRKRRYPSDGYYDPVAFAVRSGRSELKSTLFGIAVVENASMNGTERPTSFGGRRLL